MNTKQMISQKEFMDIITKHAVLRPNGTVYISNEEIALQYKNFIKHHAIEEGSRELIDNIRCTDLDIVCF